MEELELRSKGNAPPNDARSSKRVSFPQTPEEFETDPRVSYSRLDSKWILEDDDGTEWEYSDTLQRWMPSLDEALLDRQREAYLAAGVDDSEQAVTPNKRKKDDACNSEQGSGNKRKKPKPDERTKPERKNTAVYVTSLPLDTTINEVARIFSRCGVIQEAVDSGDPRIKLYTDEEGNFKGDALVVYFRPESVKLAIQMLDDSDFRLGEANPMGKMRVKEADYSYKKQQDAPQTTSMKDKKKIIKKTQKMNNKLADWDDDDPAVQDINSRKAKVVILRHMFTLQELEEDPAALLDIKDDIREECSKLGEVTNVVLYDKEPSGIVTVRFSESEAAQACVRLMSGRQFDGRTVEAEIAEGGEKFKKSKDSKETQEDDEDKEEARRLNEFGEWLEKEG